MTISNILNIDLINLCLGKKIYTKLYSIKYDTFDVNKNSSECTFTIQLQLWKL